MASKLTAQSKDKKSKSPTLNKVAGQQYEMVGVNALRPHPRNPRRGNVAAIQESIAENGFYGVVVVQRSTNYILAGNHRYKAAKEEGINEIPVVYIDVDDDRALKILLADNRANDKASYDDKELAAILSELSNTSDLIGSLYSEADLDSLINGVSEQDAPQDVKDNPYSRKIKAPTYEIKGECPEVSEMVNTTKMDSLVNAINQIDLPSDVAAFLKLAATRHAVFNYGRIAEFYAHASVEIQDLMEDSALVIIDFDKALENGFVMITEELRQIYELEKNGENQDDDAE